MATRTFAAPLSAVDKLEIDDDGTVTAIKDIVAHDPYLAGHYPHFTIYPGVFSIETVYQAARAALSRDGGTAELAGIISVHFKAPLLPGDRLTAELTLRPSPEDPSIVRVKARCTRADGQTAGRITLAMRVSS
jgi:3-hydroxyacyl-[acyl-carrier-protein] dehydratase